MPLGVVGKPDKYWLAHVLTEHRPRLSVVCLGVLLEDNNSEHESHIGDTKEVWRWSYLASNRVVTVKEVFVQLVSVPQEDQHVWHRTNANANCLAHQLNMRIVGGLAYKNAIK